MPPPPKPLRAEIPPELLAEEISPCSFHGKVPFWLRGREWVCGDCEPWNGCLAHWKLSGETLEESLDRDKYRDTWVMI